MNFLGDNEKSSDNSSRICHYFCCDSEESLYNWQKALESHIVSSVATSDVISNTPLNGPKKITKY